MLLQSKTFESIKFLIENFMGEMNAVVAEK